MWPISPTPSPPALHCSDSTVTPLFVAVLSLLPGSHQILVIPSPCPIIDIAMHPRLYWTKPHQDCPYKPLWLLLDTKIISDSSTAQRKQGFASLTLLQ